MRVSNSLSPKTVFLFQSVLVKSHKSERKRVPNIGPHLKIIPFPVDRPGERIFFFFFFWKFLIYAELSLNYTRKKIFRIFFLFPGRPGDYFWSHPVDRKQTFFLVLPSATRKENIKTVSRIVGHALEL